MIWCFFGYGVDDDDALALGGHFLAIVVVYLGMLWFILLLFGLVSFLLVAIICNSSSRLILLRLGREYKCIHPYFSSIIILSIELLFARVC
jgi:hypothetical protein